MIPAAKMDKTRDTIKKLATSKFFFPALLLFIGVLAFGLLAPQLGFYWDDWPVILMAEQGTADFFREFYSYDRPISFWMNFATLPFLGVAPLNWQIFTLLMRVLAALLFWQLLQTIWPRASFLAAAASLLFLVHPSFQQGFISVTYSQHFIVYCLLLFSLRAMLHSFDPARPRRLWAVLALSTAALHMFTMEYFAGLELLRPLLLFVYFLERGQKQKEGLRRALRGWLPYLLLLIAFFVWRAFLANIPEDPNPLKFPGALGYIQATLQDLVVMLVDTWAKTFNATLINFSDRAVLLSFLLAGLAAVICAAYLHFLPREKQAAESRQARRAAMLGLAAIPLGMIPVTLTSRTLVSGFFADRFALPAMFGAALFLAGMLQLLLGRGAWRALLAAALIGLAVGAHFRTANVYRWDWVEQQRAYWQMLWRAPSLQPRTAFVGPGVLATYASDYAASAAVNVLYNAPLPASGRMQYWVLDYYDDLAEADEGQIFGLRNLNFIPDSQKLIFYDNSSFGQCLWVLNASDEYNSDVDPAMRRVTAESNLKAISATPSSVPPAAVFGPEPPHEWCYYFQKIDLARQLGDWDELLSLWQTAAARGFGPNNQHEMMPVVEALLHRGEQAEALELSIDMLRKQPSVRQKLCRGWESWLPDAALPQDLVERGC